MSDRPKVYVAGVGMITPVGFDAASTAAAVRAGISGYSQSSFYNKFDGPMTVASVPNDALPELHKDLTWLPLTGREKRLLRLLGPALIEVFEQFSDLELQQIPLLLAAPEPIKDVVSGVRKDFISLMSKQTGIQLDLKNSRLLNTGRAGGLQAINLAFQFFEQTGREWLIVGGVDSLLDSRLLGLYDSEDRILAEGVADGFAPGEAAGFLLLTTNKNILDAELVSVAEIYQPSLTSESGHRYSDQPYKGDGLANAFLSALNNSNLPKIDHIYSTMNGENFGAKEYGVAYLRSKNKLDQNVQLHHPAECFGDIGAAFAPILIGLIKKLSSQGSLCYCSSEQELRAAVVVAL